MVLFLRVKGILGDLGVNQYLIQECDVVTFYRKLRYSRDCCNINQSYVSYTGAMDLCNRFKVS